MVSRESESDRERFFDSRVGLSLLGIAYLLAGLALFYSLLTDSIEVFSVFLVAMLVLIVVSLYVLYRREGLVTAENTVIGVFVLLAMGVLFGLYEFTGLPSEVVFGAVLVVGVIIPWILLQYSGLGAEK